jgi:hypothetical protein
VEKSALAGRQEGLLEVVANSAPARLRPTALGRRFLNRLVSRFLAED